MANRHGYLILEKDKKPYFTTNMKKGKERFNGENGTVYEWTTLWCSGICRFEYNDNQNVDCSFSHSFIEAWENLLNAEWDSNIKKPKQEFVDKMIEYSKGVIL